MPPNLYCINSAHVHMYYLPTEIGCGATSLEQKRGRLQLQSTCHKSQPQYIPPLQLDLTSSFIIEGSRDAREVKHHIISFRLSSLMMKMNWCIKYAPASVWFSFWRGIKMRRKPDDQHVQFPFSLIFCVAQRKLFIRAQ